MKYTGERAGIVDWELTAKIARKFIDKPLIELETLKGSLQAETRCRSIHFTGSKGTMDTDKETGNVDKSKCSTRGIHAEEPVYGFRFQERPYDHKGCR